MRTMLKKEGKNLVLLLVGILIYDIGTHAFVEPAQVAPEAPSVSPFWSTI